MLYMQRGGGRAALWITAGTEVHRCLGSGGWLQSEREFLCAWSRDTVAIRYFSFFSVVNIIWVMDQSQPMTRVLSIPVHVVMLVSLMAAQSHLSSCLSDLVSWILGDCRLRVACNREWYSVMMLPQGKGLGISRKEVHPWPALTCPQKTEGHIEEVGAHFRISEEFQVFQSCVGETEWGLSVTQWHHCHWQMLELLLTCHFPSLQGQVNFQ
jgi:hypothetical protein